MNLINAKFSPRWIETGSLVRRKLIDKIAYNRNKRVILITAPAGYGKTTLLSQCHKELKGKVAWYQLDKFDDEKETFITFFAEGIKKHIHNDSLNFSREDFENNNIRELAAKMLNSFSEGCQTEGTIVLDDFHYITKDEIKEFIAVFIKYLPKNIRIIIASRVRPDIELDLIAQGSTLLEIGKEDLKFSQEEEEEYINRAKNENANLSIQYELLKKNNGWPFGLNLLKYSDYEQEEGKLKLQDYYNRSFENIFTGFENKDFLLSTCLLEFMEEEICDYIMNIKASGEILSKMLEEGIFISKTDFNTYKYHDLFREFLQNKVKDKSEKYSRIAEYYLDKNKKIEAIEYLLLAKDYEKAEKILAEEGYRYISISYSIYVHHWSKLIPKEISADYGALALIKALHALKDPKPELGGKYIEQGRKVFERLRDEEGLLKADTFKVNSLWKQKRWEEGYELANRIYTKLESRTLEEKVDILSEKLYIGSFLHKLEEEYKILKKEAAEIENGCMKPYELKLLALLEYASYLIGDYPFAMSIKQKYSEGRLPLNSIVYTLRIYLVWGRLKEGRQYVKKEIDNALHYELNQNLPELYAILAEMEFHLGNNKEAEKCFIKTLDMFENKDNPLFYLCAFSYINCLAFWGRKKEALQLINLYYKKISKQNEVGLMMAEMMLCQSYLIMKEYELAIFYAKKCMLPSEKFNTKLYMATLSSVIAAAYLAMDEEDKAVQYAKTAMELSEKGYYIQDYIKHFEHYIALFELCEKQGINTKFIEEIKSKHKALKRDDAPQKNDTLQDSDVTQKNHTLEDSDPPTENSAQERLLWAEFFGDISVRDGDKLIRWRTVKAKNIFFYLLYKSKTGVTKDRIIDLFFEEYDYEKASNNVRTSITYIRKTLKESGFEEALLQTDGRYYLNSKIVKTDIEEFEEILNKLEEVNTYNSREELVQRLCKVYKGAFCESIDIYDVNLEREKYFYLFEKQVLDLAEEQIKTGKNTEALALINILIKHQNYTEKYYLMKKEIYNATGNERMIDIIDNEMRNFLDS